MNTKRTLFVTILAAAATASLLAAVPVVSDVTMTQDASRRVTITYTLSDAPAVVTVDIQTNANGSSWSSIGGEGIWNATGDVWKKVETSSGTISWHPDLSWPDHRIAEGGARAVVTAWSLDNTPDYMVVDISAGTQTNSQRYYPAVDFLPGSELGQKGAVTNNVEYKTSKIVMRKIMAKDVLWTSGATKMEASTDSTHEAQLTNNFYIGVFEVTQGQWATIRGNASLAYFTNAAHRAERPMESVSFNEVRLSPDKWQRSGYEWPHAPNPESFLGFLRSKTGLAFDLPSQAQWEFACRAGHGSGYWGDGTPLLGSNADANLDKLGRYKSNGGYIDGTTAPGKAAGVENGTAIVGSYAPNSWGLYDMHGNVGEMVLDGASTLAQLTTRRGMVMVPGDPSADATYRRVLGGNYRQTAVQCRPGRLLPVSSESVGDNLTQNVNEGTSQFGLRLACQAGLK